MSVAAIAAEAHTMPEIRTIEAESKSLATHVQMCALRHEEVSQRLAAIEAQQARWKRIEWAVYAVGAAVMGGNFLSVEQMRAIGAILAKVAG